MGHNGHSQERSASVFQTLHKVLHIRSVLAFLKGVLAETRSGDPRSMRDAEQIMQTIRALEEQRKTAEVAMAVAASTATQSSGTCGFGLLAKRRLKTLWGNLASGTASGAVLMGAIVNDMRHIFAASPRKREIVTILDIAASEEAMV